VAESQRAGRTCVIRPGALGDAILTLPVLESLRAGCLGVGITVVGPAAFELAVDCGLARDYVAFDDVRLLGLFTEGGTSQVVAGCETCLVYGKGPDAALAASLRRSGVARLIEWPAWPAAERHIVDHLLGAAEAAGCPIATRVPRLRLETSDAGLGTREGGRRESVREWESESAKASEKESDSSRCHASTLPPSHSPMASRVPHPIRGPFPPSWLAAADAFLAQQGVRGGFAAIHPGSGGRPKRWAAPRFVELAARLPWPVVWLLGPAELEGESVREWERESAGPESEGSPSASALSRSHASALSRALGLSRSDALTLSRSHVPTVAAGLPLRTVAGLLARCRVYIGNDSGMSHLAAAVGAPTVAIFGPTDPRVWGPRGPHVRIVGEPDAGGLDAVTVEEVLDAVRETQGESRQSAGGSRQ